MPSSELAALLALSELDFTMNKVKPLFEVLGYRGVTYVGGASPPERGRDVVFYEFDEKLMQQRHMAAQVKKGNIGASVASRLLTQIDEAFNHPHRDPQTGKQVRISRLFIVASGKIRDSVKERIERERHLLFPFITFWDGEQVLQYEKMFVSNPTRISRAESFIHSLGLDELFDDDRFIEQVSNELEKMFEEMKLSELMVVAKLPEILFSLEEVRSRIDVLPISDQKEILDCLSILIVNRSNFNYGAEGKYGIQRPKRTRA